MVGSGVVWGCLDLGLTGGVCVGGGSFIVVMISVILADFLVWGSFMGCLTTADGGGCIVWSAYLGGEFVLLLARSDHGWGFVSGSVSWMGPFSGLFR
jgi:hypothetical protein